MKTEKYLARAAKARAAAAGKTGGLPCPDCGGVAWVIVRSKRITGNRARTQICANVDCQCEVRTYERIVHKRRRERVAT